MSEEAGFRVTEAALDPKWKIAPVEWDGSQLLILRIEHPRHGPIDLMLKQASATAMRDTLIRALAKE